MTFDDKPGAPDAGPDDKPGDDAGAKGGGDDDQTPGGDEDQGGDDDKGAKESRFFDSKKVPPELQPVYKGMQKAFTEKLQKASLGIRKAQAFDELVANPDFQAWVADKNGSGTKPKPKVKSRDDDDDDDGDKNGSPDIEGMIERAVARSLAPIVRGEHRKNAQAEWKGLVEKFPQAENYRDEIADTMKEFPGISYDKAFKMVAFDDAIDIGNDSAMKSVAAKKRAQTGRPSSLSPGDKPPPKAKSIPEAFQQALKQQKEKEKG